MNDEHSISRRRFVQATAATAGAFALGGLSVARSAQVAGSDVMRIGLIGCGGRGTGAAFNALDASENTRIVALADVFEDRLNGCREQLASRGERGQVARDRCYVGFNAYKELLAGEMDIVMLATPPHFRPMHFEAAINSGCHVFMEKPVAVDPVGIRTVLDAARMADEKNLKVVAGTQRRHEKCYLEAMKRIEDGAIGSIIAAHCYWNMGGLWMNEPRPEWSEMEWQLRNWLYFTWLSGDHIVEQHVHNLDVCNWAIQSTPVRALGMGGRQVRTDSNYGNVFDHFAVEFRYPNGVYVTSMCRQTDGCAGRVEEILLGSDGQCRLAPGSAVIEGRKPWRFNGDNTNPYMIEHRDLHHAIANGTTCNEARTVAESTLTAIMGRMSAYTGKEVSWEFAMNSKLDLSPERYEFGDLAVRPVAVPGKTPLI